MELTFYNTSDQLTFSGDGIVYSYVGRASPVSLTQPGTDTVLSTGGSSTYSIAWGGDILVVLPLKTNGSTVLLGATQSNGVWTITVHKSTGALNSNSFDVQEYTEVYVFGAPPAGASSTFMLYDGNGNPTGDLSRLPLMVKAILSLSNNPTDSTWTSLGGIAAPGIVGAPLGYKTTSVRSGTTWTNRQYGYAWLLDANGNISRTQLQTSFSKDDGGIAVQSGMQPVSSIVTSVAGL